MEYIYASAIVLMIMAGIFIGKRIMTRRVLLNNSSSSLLDIKTRPWIIEKANDTSLSAYTQRNKLVLTEKLKDGLGGLLKLTPEAKQIITKESKLLFKFSDEISKGIDKGIYKQMMAKGSNNQYLGMAADNKGKIVGHGKQMNQDIKKINPAKLANVALGVMSVVTAQEYLDRINQQLLSIDRKVDTIYRHLKNQQYGISKGNLEHLKLISLGMYDITDKHSMLYQSDILRVINATLQQIEGIMQSVVPLMSEMVNLDVKSWVKMDKYETMILDIIKNFDDYITLGIGNLEVLAVSVKIHNELPGKSVNFDNAALEKTEYYLSRFQEIELEFTRIANQKMSELNASMRSSEKNFERYTRLGSFLDNVKLKIHSSYNDVQSIHNDEVKITRPFDIQIECDSEGNVVNAYQLVKQDVS
ncbi:hypothetical protein [Paenibacillus mesotrionivorans]|uniref:Uncharacterized protein n=1 Tax=Paenibacillus mesotrionivorans TaxID=3160968 RepID=A0ACC7NYE9_9BACL